MIHVRRLAALAISGLLLVLMVGCSSNQPSESTTTGGEYTIARGNLTVDVSASGNLAFSTQEDLAFDMAGTVQDILVEVGDQVTKGEVVATLDTSDQEEQLRSLQISVLSAQISLRQAQRTLDNDQETTQTSITGDVVVQSDDNEDQVKIDEMQVEQAQFRLQDAQANLESFTSQSPQIVAPFDGFVTKVSVEGGDEVYKGSVACTVADPNKFEASILVSENDISQIAVGSRAQVSIDAMSNVIVPAEVTAIAPTATISSGVVNYEVTVQLANVQSTQAQQGNTGGQGQTGQSAAGSQGQGQQGTAGQAPEGASGSETTQTGQGATTETQAAISQGETSQAGTAGGAEQSASGQMPERLQQAIDSGQMTEEQAQQILERMQSGGGNGGFGSTTAAAAASSLSNVTLREGLSVTVTIIVAQATNVLLVPNSAISTQGTRTYVTVINSDGTETQTEITVGASNYQYSEVTSGLNEGDVVKTATNTASTTTTSRGGGGAFFFGGPGGARG